MDTVWIVQASAEGGGGGGGGGGFGGSSPWPFFKIIHK